MHLEQNRNDCCIDRIRAEVEGHPVVLFMKGTPQFPMCGFSSRASEGTEEGRARRSTR
jgi:monothiol glutaredoxin